MIPRIQSARPHRDVVDVDTSTMRVNAGKGNRDRVVLFPEGLRLPLRLYLDSTQQNVYLFETRRRERMSERWVQLLARRYGLAAGIEPKSLGLNRHFVDAMCVVPRSK